MLQFEPETFLPNIPLGVKVIDNQGHHEREEIYQVNPRHRDSTPQKSKWTIGRREEVGVFGWALENNSRSGDFYWGVYLIGQVANVLGHTSRSVDSKIARFEGSGRPRVWHGYPADYTGDPQHDCPHRDVLFSWAEMGIITKNKIAKLIGGQGWKD